MGSGVFNAVWPLAKVRGVGTVSIRRGELASGREHQKFRHFKYEMQILKCGVRLRPNTAPGKCSWVVFVRDVD